MSRSASLVAPVLALALLAAAGPAPAAAQDDPATKPKATKSAETGEATTKGDEPDGKAPKTEFAILGGGCFWCLEAVYERIPGVVDVISGYAGGSSRRPTYDQVSAGVTGHAEVVRVEFDPKVISYDKILHIFFEIHDPTTLNSQGPDFGTQYRSIILAVDQAQRDTALKVVNEFEQRRAFRDPIVTELVPLKIFYPAEKHHQDYFRLHPNADYCQTWIVPKVQKMMQKGEIPPPQPRQATKKKR